MTDQIETMITIRMNATIRNVAANVNATYMQAPAKKMHIAITNPLSICIMAIFLVRAYRQRVRPEI